MTTQVREVADEIVELCRQGKHLDAIDRFYAPNVISTEAEEMGGMPREIRGQPAVRAKNEAWVNGTQVHSRDIRGPFPHGEDQFAVFSRYEVTPKKTGKRTNMEEIGVYTVRNGKIVDEKFFYSM
jgi:ketosteroid isomerase-like protein